MTESVYIPPHQTRVRRGGQFVPPLLLISLIVYNVVAFLFMGGNPAGWNGPMFSIFMVSGSQWIVTAGDLVIAGSLILLFIELVKSTRFGSSAVLEHMLSMVVFVAFLIEFLLVGAAASSTFFLLMVMSLIDVVAGFTVSITGARRDFSSE